MIPSIIIINANADNKYVLLSMKQEDNYIEAKLIDNSKHLLSNVVLKTDGIEGLSELYTFKRVSTRHSPKYYTSHLIKTTNYVIVPWHEPIYIYTMTHSKKILSSDFYKVCNGLDTCEKWHFKIPEIIVDEPQTDLHIPFHIVQGFVESFILKKEVCPITLEPFVMGQIAMTPCGHLFDKKSLDTIVICPTCRADIKGTLQMF
jgi:hypothetical protein